MCESEHTFSKQTHTNNTQTHMVTTIEEFVHELETNYNSEDLINVEPVAYRLLNAMKDDTRSHSFCSAYRTEKWDCLDLKPGNSKVSDVLAMLKTFLPEHKDKCISMFIPSQGRIMLATRKITAIKTCTMDFSKTIDQIPRIKNEKSIELWSQFETQIQKFKDMIQDSSNTQNSLVPIAQFFFLQHPEINGVYCISNTFYHTYDDVLKAYPGLTEDDCELFEDNYGVCVCHMTSEELKLLSESRTTPKYKTSEGTFTRVELLNRYTLTDSQIDKLFQLDANSIMVSQIPELISALAK